MKRIMIIEDDEDITNLVTEVLKNEGFNVECFNLAKKGLQYLKKNDLPDLMLLDMRMPDMTGVDFLKTIKDEKKLDKLRVVLFTATIEVNTSKLPDKHVKGVIYKPFDINNFVKQVKKYL